ncbi:DEAD/DEAH box helicase [Paraclostridium bifermentans]|uniref:DEAD/DEAH box helicase n=1 Tax=Paraclostridium TaxID=1849822 RepID=UPI00038C8ADD|nr:DEAD/DEAH box helicase [Paraclostridium bifermentans]EQK39045.1 ATP-dependent RNA helicase dbpA [[Clostridium] bifermentans ATCC 19299] [Paraclostridium bifermentans ATCC 19299]MCR1875839.1 DEAD/DEAH box helicase [Paraclostridium bifermentans]TQO56561.1 DEAD/DEAH box helicase [Paraclostridium bifermentans]GKZ02080.1 ATP-dependent RNA helicase DbpA [Paraclostridium bifermentans]GKZ05363.1 ATP-dependent RNA helicase DbpA [Paraclostridium bifermentans]
MTNINFKDYKLSNEILKSLNMLNYKTPTKVQQEVIPVALENKDVLVKSQTGSGKTATFAIPLCELVDWDENKPQALILTPTRELAIQVKEDVFNIGRFKRIKVPALYGKSSFSLQAKELKQKTHIVVGTPGRTIDHIKEGNFITDNIKYLVLDEADEMLSMGFLEQVEEIISLLPKNRVTMLFSATMPDDINRLSKKYMKNHVTIEIEAKTLTVDRIQQDGYNIEETGKLNLLKDVTTIENPDSCVIFCNTQVKVESLYNELRKLKYPCDKIHGGMEQDERIKVMNNFKKGYFRYLIATDVAARGIDIDNITHVINYDVPVLRENYVHRIGRTGRAGKEGRAITFVMKSDERRMFEIYSYTGKELTMKMKPSKRLVMSLKPEFDKKLEQRQKVKEDKGANLSQEIMKIHINAGKKTKMRPVDIVGTLCSIEGMKAEDIGVISVLDISTYVEILNNKGEMVLKALQTKNIKGRPRKVTKADM